MFGKQPQTLAEEEQPDTPPRALKETCLWMAALSLGLAGLFGLGQMVRDDFALAEPIWLSGLLAAALLVACFVDIRSYILPDLITLPLIVLGLGWHVSRGDGVILSLAGLVLGYGLIFGLRLIWLHWRDVEAIGLGDAKLLAAGGAFCGVFALPVILLIGSGLGLLCALAFRLTGQLNSQLIVPFGPFLSLGIWAAWCLPHLYSG